MAEGPRAPARQLEMVRALSQSCGGKYERKSEKKRYRDTGSTSSVLLLSNYFHKNNTNALRSYISFVSLERSQKERCSHLAGTMHKK